jgi:hypothetical protein
MGQYMAAQDNWKLHSCGCMPTNGTARTPNQKLALMLNASCDIGREESLIEIGNNVWCAARQGQSPTG